MLPMTELGRDGLVDAGKAVVCPLCEVSERSPALLLEIERAIFENAAEKPARVARRHQPVDGADGERLIGDRKIGPDADKGGSSRISPEWLSALGGHEQHRGDLRQPDPHLVERQSTRMKCSH